MNRYALLLWISVLVSLLPGCRTRALDDCRGCEGRHTIARAKEHGDPRTLLVSATGFHDDYARNEDKKNGTTLDEDPKKKNGNGKNGKGDEEGPKHIRDNGFLVEEAFNQEKDEVQHIFNWINLWTHNREGRGRDFVAAYTMELPLGSQKHQFSFVIPFLTTFEQPSGRPGVQQGDIGDILLNYRYQLLADDEFLWCAPRLSLILPTGDKRLGTGTGEVGYQFNLPISKYGERFDFHLNAGYTFIPNVSIPIETELPGPPPVLAMINSPKHDLRGYNFGASVFYKPETYLHFFVETLVQGIEEIDERGFRDSLTQVFVNPGVRYAIIQDPVEWVIGLSVPIGLTRDTPDIGIFAYMSVEFSFRKKHNGDGNGNGK